VVVAKTLKAWVEEDVNPVRGKPMRWLCENFFFRDPVRPTYSDTSTFYSPADGIVLYAMQVAPDDSVVDIKGRRYSLRDAMREPEFDRECIVIGIFMTFYDVHVNRIPYAGRLTWKELDPIDTHNRPMLDVEKALLEDLRVDAAQADYLHENQRMVNRIYAPALRDEYFVLQIADYDVDCITPFELKQNRHFTQNRRFSQIRFGSQVDLIVPLSPRYELHTLVDVGMHVQAGIDPLIHIVQ
jgi:phosphatidylserine decarboxylase